LARQDRVTDVLADEYMAADGDGNAVLEVAAQRGLSRFVGRHEQLEQLQRAWEAARDGRGQIVAVMGEAGVGKSRLFHEFKGPLQSQCPVLETFSVSHGKAYAYLPLLELLKGYFRIRIEDDEGRRQEKVTGTVLTLDRALEDTLPEGLGNRPPAAPTGPWPSTPPRGGWCFSGEATPRDMTIPGNGMEMTGMKSSPQIDRWDDTIM
jgi:hypothetical protein